MSTFTDNQNRSWTLAVDIPAARRIRQELGVDILDWEGENGVPRLASDPILLCDVLWLLVADQAAGRNVSDEDFGRSLQGQPLDDACEAFMSALINFFPPRQREILTAMQATAHTLTDDLTGMARETMHKLQTLDRGGRRSPAGKASSADRTPAPSGNSSGPTTNTSSGTGTRSPS